MCDYSLLHLKSRAANVGDKLVVTNFGTGTRGFASPEDANTPVCVLPGTEVAFDSDIQSLFGYVTPGPAQEHRTAVFAQVDKEVPCVHHDCLELPCGTRIMLTHLVEGQRATVLQLPAAPKTEAEVEEQRRAEFV